MATARLQRRAFEHWMIILLGSQFCVWGCTDCTLFERLHSVTKGSLRHPALCLCMTVNFSTSCSAHEAHLFCCSMWFCMSGLCDHYDLHGGCDACGLCFLCVLLLCACCCRLHGGYGFCCLCGVHGACGMPCWFSILHMACGVKCHARVKMDVINFFSVSHEPIA